MAAGDVASNLLADDDDVSERLVATFMRVSRDATLASLGVLVAGVVGARTGRLFVADYGLRHAQETAV